MKIRPDIYDYIDYRQFIRDFMDYLRENQGVTVRAFAKAAGLKCSSYVGRVIKGDRQLTDDTATKIATGLNLTKYESNFLLALVKFNHAKLPQDQDAAYQEILAFKGFRKIQYVEADHYEYMSHWYYPALMAAMTTHWAKRPIADIAESLGVSEHTVQQGLDLLQKMGFLKKQDGQLVATQMAVDTSTSTTNLKVRNFHREMITKALESIDQLETDERELGSITIGLSQEDFDSFRNDLRTFRTKLIAKYSKDASDEIIYQLNLQLFPLMKPPAKQEHKAEA